MVRDRARAAGHATDRALRAAILAVVAEGVRQRNPGAVANGLVAFVATFLPGVLGRRLGLALGPAHRVWVSSAMLLHAAGMLGPYDDTWWWDHVTHTLSSSIVGAAAYLVARRRGRDPTRAVVGATLGLGVLWEALEYAIHRAFRRVGLDPLLVNYGRKDTALDLAYDAVGALLVLTVGRSALDDAIEDGERD